MAITPTITTAVNTVNGTSISVANPAWNGSSSTPGVFVTVWAMASNTTTLALNTGGTAFTAVTTSSGQNTQVQLYYAFTDGTEASTFGITAGTSRLLGAIGVAWAGVTATPFDPGAPSTSGQCVNPANTNLPANGITTTINGDLLVWFGLTRSAAPPNQVITLPSGFTNPSGFSQVNSPSTGATIGFTIGIQTQTTAGATGTQTGTQPAAQDGGALLFALTPAGGTQFTETLTSAVGTSSTQRVSIAQTDTTVAAVSPTLPRRITKHIVFGKWRVF